MFIARNKLEIQAPEEPPSDGMFLKAISPTDELSGLVIKIRNINLPSLCAKDEKKRASILVNTLLPFC